MKTSVVLLLVLLAMVFAHAPSEALQVGDKAPLFEGASTQGAIKLDDFFGKKHVILAFYFADFTPG